ncbi:hypothetical protein ACHWQZ_G003378 [Mnemiopsis leidyi]
MRTKMSVLYSISVTLLLIAICHSYGGISQKGCAYHVPENGETFGRCDLDNSFCSYGCQKGYCWKQCLNKENECVINHRGYTFAVDEQGSYITCQTEEDCILKSIDFGKDDKCYIGDPTY